MNPHLPPELLSLLAERLGWALLHSVWQGAVIAGPLALLLRFLRSAAARHAACLLALLGLAVAVVTTFALVRPARPISVVSAALLADAPAAAPPLPIPAESAESPRALPATTAVASPSRPSWRERFEPMVPRLSGAWLIGVALLSLRHLLGWQRVRVLRRSGVEARPELQRTFARLVEKFGCTSATRLLESAHVAVPMLAGLVKPAVLLPLRVVTGLRACEIEAILAHELAHLVRRDAWSNLAQVAIETLLFYHPAVWWIGWRARQERENAADDLALEVCADRRVYASALAQLAELHCASPMALAATGGSLLARIQRIVRPERIESPAAGWSLCLPPLLAALALALTPLFRAEAQPPKPAVATEQGAAKSESLANSWIADAFQLDDAAKRTAAIERIHAAMRSSDPDEARAGVTAFGKVESIEFDKAAFRPEVRALLASPDAPTRAAAAHAITITGAEPADLERILALADDPAEEVRAVLTSVIVRLKKKDLREKAASDAILKLMARLPRDSRDVAHSLWGSQLSPEIETKALEFCRTLERASNSDVGYNFFYGTLSTQANKSEATVRRLIELLAHEDITNIAGRAAWGLQQGVDRTQYRLVADSMVKVIEARSDGSLRDTALRCLRTYGNAAQVPALQALLDRPGVTGDFRHVLTQLLAAFQRPASPEPKGVSSEPRIGQNAKALEAIADETAKLKAELENSELPETERQKKANILRRLSAADVSIAPKPLETNHGREATELGQTLEFLKAHHEEPDLSPEERLDVGYAIQDLSALASKEGFLPKINRQAAQRRAGADAKRYSAEQLQEIESLYQVANKNWRTPAARESLQKLLEKYDRANRTGCATLYMGELGEGQERLDYLTRAVEKFSDCYYLDGCQVGGYGRYVLAIVFWEKGFNDKAKALLRELTKKFPDSIDHRGQRMTTLAKALEKKFAAEK